MSVYDEAQKIWSVIQLKTSKTKGLTCIKVQSKNESL
jgi:hypothetical protein